MFSSDERARIQNRYYDLYNDLYKKNSESISETESESLVDDPETNARQLLDLGIAEIERENYPKALELFGEALELNVELINFSVYWYKYGIILFNQEKYYEAIENFQRALELNNQWGEDSSPAAYYSIGLAYEKLNQLELAINYCQEASKLNPDYKQKLELLAERIRKDIEAEELAQKCKEQLQAKEYSQAYESYQKILQLNPHVSSYWYDLGLVAYNLGKYPQVIEPTEQAIAINDRWENRNLADVLYLKAICYYQIGFTTEAIASIKKVLEVDSNHNRASESISVLTSRNKNKKRAYDWAQLGFKNITLENNVEVRNCFNNAVQLDPSVSLYWYQLSLSLIEAQEYNKALQAIETALLLNNQWQNFGPADAWCYRGWILENLDDKKKALASYQKAIYVSNNNHPLALEHYEELNLQFLSGLFESNITSSSPINTKITNQFNNILFDTLEERYREEWIKDIQITEIWIDLLISIVSSFNEIKNNRDIAAHIYHIIFKQHYPDEWRWVGLSLSLLSTSYSLDKVINSLGIITIFKVTEIGCIAPKNRVNLDSETVDLMRKEMSCFWDKEIAKVTNYWQQFLYELINWVELIPEIVARDGQKQNLLKTAKLVREKSNIMLDIAFKKIRATIEDLIDLDREG